MIASGATSGGQSETAWMLQELEQALVQVEQYLVCEMQAIVSESTYTIQQTMKQEEVDCYNSYVQGVVQQVHQRCQVSFAVLLC